MRGIISAFGVQFAHVELSHRWAPVKPLPGTRMSCWAPAERIASMAAWSLVSTSSVGMVWGSFIMPKTIFGLDLKRVLSSDQNEASWEVVDAVGSDEFPIMLPDWGCIDGSL